MLDIRFTVTPELRETIRLIDEAKQHITPVQDMSPEQRERWAREYAEDAACHGARLDQYMRTVTG